MLDSRAADWERGGARVPASQLVWARRSRRGRPSANDGYRASRTLAFVHHVAFRFADAARVIQASVVAGEFDIRARLRLAEPWVAEPWVRSSDSTRRTLGCRTLGCRTLGCRTLGCRTPGSVERFDSPNPGLPNPGLPHPGFGRAIRLAEPWVAEPWVAEPWVAEPWVRSSDSTRRTL